MRALKDLQRKLHGYRATYRGRWLLLQQGILTKEEFLLYEVSVDFSDWTKDRSTYGSFDLTQQEIEVLVNFTGGYVSKYSKKLYSLGLWEKREDGRIQVKGFELTETNLLKEITKKNQLVDPIIYFANQQIQLVETKNEFAKTQNSSSKDIDQFQPQKFVELQKLSFISKDTNSFKNRVIASSTVRSNEEYKVIIQEGGYQLLTIDDLRWIDTNIVITEERRVL